MKFDKKYTEYWANTVDASVDGTVIAGLSQVEHFLNKLTIQRNDRILDLGCSFGRMCQALSRYSDFIYGVEPDEFAVTEATKKSYIDVKQGYAESTGYSPLFFDVVFSWAVFDVVNHLKSLIEVNKILKINGKFIFTGKNDIYPTDDVLGFTAEKNAYLKGHPNRFTDLKNLVTHANNLGFQINNIYLFRNRGDFGLLKFNEVNAEELEYIGYEYLVIATKIGSTKDKNIEDLVLDSPFTKTALLMAKAKGFNTPKAMFESLGVT